jgi:hypothetical protein
VSIKLTRAIVLGFLALLTVGSFGASAAFAEAGPFWHSRAKGGTGNGVKIEEKAPEQFNGEGAEQILKGTIAELATEITAKSVQAKGIIYNNNALQGQIKVLLIYHEPKLVKPIEEGCEVKIGTNNEVKAEGHLAWKWNGTKAQLEEKQQKVTQKPDIIFTPAPIKAGETKLPEGKFTEITLGKSCGVLVGTFAVKGSQSVTTKPANIEEWSTTLTTIFPGWKQQHFWNGTEFVGVEPGLVFGKNTATLTGSVESQSAVNEISVFEK